MARGPRLVPPPARGHRSVARVADDWYVVGRSKDIVAAPRAFTLLGTPLVLFRTADGTPGALLDRCAHRNVPLSCGRAIADTVECPYHGWRFDRDGECRRVPGLVGEPAAQGRRVPAYACRDQDGFLWVYATPDAIPERSPYRFRYADRAEYTTVVESLEAEGSLHATAENALDVPHTSFVHRGLFRRARDRRTIEVIVRRSADQVEAQYVGEPRPSGLLGRLMSVQTGPVEHYDRFLLPSIVEVEYRLGDTHLIAAAALTPITDFQTQLFAVVSYRAPGAARLLTPVLRRLALRVFQQDAQILKQQSRNIERFGGERFVSTPADVMGAHILRLLRNAERGKRATSGETLEKRVEICV